MLTVDDEDAHDMYELRQRNGTTGTTTICGWHTMKDITWSITATELDSNSIMKSSKVTPYSLSSHSFYP